MVRFRFCIANTDPKHREPLLQFRCGPLRAFLSAELGLDTPIDLDGISSLGMNLGMKRHVSCAANGVFRLPLATASLASMATSTRASRRQNHPGLSRLPHGDLFHDVGRAPDWCKLGLRKREPGKGASNRAPSPPRATTCAILSFSAPWTPILLARPPASFKMPPSRLSWRA